MTKFYYINQSTKELAPTTLGRKTSIVFSLDFAKLNERTPIGIGLSGRTRIQLDAACHISSTLTDKPIFISSENLQDFLNQKPHIMTVFVGHTKEHEKLIHHPNFFSVQLDPSCDEKNFVYSDAAILTCGNKKDTLPRKCANHIFEADYFPSRAIKTLRKHTPSNESNILVYFRYPWRLGFATESYEKSLITKLTAIHKKLGCSFLISNSYRNQAIKLQEFANSIKGCEFCDMYYPTKSQPTWESFLTKATAAIVTDDTTSSLSDCCAAGIPTFLFTCPENAKRLTDCTAIKSTYYSSANARDIACQEHLLKKDIVRIFTLKNFYKRWTPADGVSWDDIGRQIGEIIREKHKSLGLQSSKSSCTINPMP